ncbi:hypothetical protein [Streptomyces roseicoloratus]|uniref:hypothetical protein n=1 Tax=Streptomyces roseicoloratus TaxID=2508722 RepID=UPI001FEA3DC2|nr:hypothetical protein [Streptomyces roseicoloratus]
MRAIRVASAALLAAVPFFLAAPAAPADDGDLPDGVFPKDAADFPKAGADILTDGAAFLDGPDVLTDGPDVLTDGPDALKDGPETPEDTPDFLKTAPDFVKNRPDLPKDGHDLPKDDHGPAKEDHGPVKDGTGHGITSFGFSVTPQTVAPGGTVTLASDGCEVPTVTVESGVFDTVTLNKGRQGTATVDHDAKAGARYEVTFDCKGERGTTTLTIAGGGHHPDPDRATGARKGVKAGFGSDGIGTTELVTGAVLIVGALGSAVVLTRRREPADTTER